MIEANDAMITGLVSAAQVAARKILDEAPSILPFGLTCDPQGGVELVMVGGGLMDCSAGDTAVLLGYEAFLNAEMRRRLLRGNVAAIALGTHRDATDGRNMALQIEFSDRCFVMLIPYSKRMLRGWSFGAPEPFDQRIFPEPQEGFVAREPGTTPFDNAFAPTPGGDAFVHRHSGFRFPARIGEFEATTLSQCDPDGLDIAFGYNHQRLSGLSVTAYVYPAPDSTGAALGAHFAKCKADIGAIQASARLLFEDAARLEGARVGRMCVFRMTGKIDGIAIDSVSELWLFTAAGRFVKFRASYPPAERASAPTAVKWLLDNLAWPDAMAQAPIAAFAQRERERTPTASR